jgi:UDP-2,4-diacetamido-2,4,6-trideoxy-beta-L-altropyranose hydrolase
MSEHTFVIRVDSSSEIGMGHLARCLALASDLAKFGAMVVFICRDHHGSGHSLVLEQNFKLHLLDGKEKLTISSNPSDWLGFTQSHDAFESSKIISKYLKAHVIVDHYGLDYLWESSIDCDSMIVIDDLANRPHQCELLIDQSLENTKLDYKELIDGNFEFIGGNMVILREEFRRVQTWQGPGTGKLLICMGGADPFGHTQGILELIISSYNRFPEEQVVSEINVIVGAAFDDISTLKVFMEESDLNISLIQAPRKVSELMLQADLCILSCGTMILEACALGVPSIGVVVADNQQSTAEFLEKAGAIELYDLRQKNDSEIFSMVSSLIGNPQRLWDHSYMQKTMVSQESNEIIVRNLYER